MIRCEIALDVARPVAEGGIPDFDGEIVSFRRCGT
jgi:hypothetical protein